MLSIAWMQLEETADDQARKAWRQTHQKKLQRFGHIYRLVRQKAVAMGSLRLAPAAAEDQAAMSLQHELDNGHILDGQNKPVTSVTNLAAMLQKQAGAAKKTAKQANAAAAAAASV